jgi:hypothetical protein
MRPVTVRLSAAGTSEWVVVDRYVQGFVVGLGVKLSSNGNLTYSVEHTFDNILQDFKPATPITRVTTTATVTVVNHGLSVGDFVRVLNGGVAPFDGRFAVATVPDQNTFTYTVVDTGAAFASIYATICTARIFAHETLAAKTVSDDGNYVAPPVACRLNVTAFTAGYVDLTVTQGGIQ